MVVNKNKKFLYKSNIFKREYYTLSELLDLKSTIELTIEKYNKNNLTDEIINRLNSESNKQEREYIPVKKPKKGLYLMSQNNSFLKIGITMDISRRLKEIKSTNPDNIKVLFFIKDVYLLEKILHLKFDKLWHDSEWFYYDESIINAFNVIDKNKDFLSKIKCKEILKEKIDKLIKCEL